MRYKLLLLLLLLYLISSKDILAQSPNFKVVGYFPNWADMNLDIENLDCSMLTHINWAFQNPDASGNLIESNDGLIKLVTKAHASNVKVLVSLGGGAASSGTTKTNYFNLISTEAKRAAFIHKIADYIEKYELQGVDIDLEGPAINSNYDAFIKQLCDTLRPKGLLITAALNGEATDALKDATIGLFDWINIMSYDATGTWTPDNPGQHSSFEYAETGINAWSKRGAKKDQLMVGVPFYGHAFRKLLYMDYYNYNQIIKVFPNAYLNDEEGDVVYYNGISTIQKKTYLAIEKAGGIMIWALSYDTYDEFSLLKAINDAIKNYNPDNSAPQIKLLSPGSDTTISNSAFKMSVITTDSDSNFEKTSIMVNNIFALESFNDTTEFTISNLSDGIYNLTVEAADKQNKIGSKALKLTVNDVQKSAFNGIAAKIPGRVEAENYDVGASNISFKDNSATNEGKFYRFDAVDIEKCNDTEGGYNIGWIATGEWLDYTIDAADSGLYQINYRLASTSSGKTLHTEINSVDITGSVVIPNSGGLQKWKTVSSKGFHLEKGIQTIRIVCNSGNFNFNYFDMVKSVPSTSKISEFEDSYAIYPNPVQNELTIKSPKNAEFQIEIFSAEGKIVYDTKFNDNLISHLLKMGDLKTGIYSIKITSSNYCQNFQFIKE